MPDLYLQRASSSILSDKVGTLQILTTQALLDVADMDIWQNGVRTMKKKPLEPPINRGHPIQKLRGWVAHVAEKCCPVPVIVKSLLLRKGRDGVCNELLLADEKGRDGSPNRENYCLLTRKRRASLESEKWKTG